MDHLKNRRQFLREAGVGAAAVPFALNLPSLRFANQNRRKQRLVVVFSPDGVIPSAFWPDQEGAEFAFKEILEPLTPFQDQTLVLKGIGDRVRGDGDGHMRGIGCLLTGIELFPGNIQGGSHTPAGWSSGNSIDQEIKEFLQREESTKTRFGSLEFGVLVPNRADTWTRMVYSGANSPVTPIDDPYQMFDKLYGNVQDAANLASVLDELKDDFKRLERLLSAEDRQLLDRNATFVRELELELEEAKKVEQVHSVPVLEKGIEDKNDQMPAISKMQIEMIVNSFVNDFSRVATLQYTNAVGQPRMTWLGIKEGQHGLSHEPDSNQDAVDKLIKINRWYCEQIAMLAARLKSLPEPGGEGTMLDNTIILWGNELGKGNSHTLENIPFVLVGGGLGFKMGRSLKFKGEPHNRLLMSLAHGFGHRLDSFGNANFCKQGPLGLG